MPKLMLINVTHSEESRVAILANGVLESFEIESLSREHLKGNIYRAVVHRIHPALEAAFVDIGAERDAFLPLDEICFRNLPNAPAQPVDENGKRQRRRIRDLIKPGEEILVQIAKEQFANKPPTLTTFYSLPGRYLVLLPGSDETGISRRIEGEERQRLRQLVEDLNPPEGFGLIVRTAAGLDEETSELAGDLTYLRRLWDSVQDAARHKRAPALVYREQDIVLRTIRDLFTPDIDEIHIDNEDVYLRAREFLRNVMPGKEHVLHCYRGEQPIFSAFDVEGQIETVFKRRVPLRSGGTIVIDGTEALTAIDVNSGGSVRGPNPEETAFRTNLEAAAEVARQLRLRDIGGLIVVDFIDMREPRHIQEVEQALRTAMKPDKARNETGRISRLGLLEISRQRLRPAAMATTYASCPMCEGHGAVRTTESAALVALRKIHNRVSLGDVASLRAALPPAVALYLLNQKRDDLARLEERYATRIHVELRDSLMPHQVEIEARERVAVAAPTPTVAPGTVAAADAPLAATNGNGAGASAGEKKRRRRRGRKRGTGLRAAAAIGLGLATLGGTMPPPYEGELPAAGDDAGAAPPRAHAAVADVGAELDEAEEEDGQEEGDEEQALAAGAAATVPAAPAGEASARRGRGRRGGRGRRRGAGRPVSGESARPTAAATDVAATVPPPPAPPTLAPPAASDVNAAVSAPPASRRRAAATRARAPRARTAAAKTPAASSATGDASAPTAPPAKRPRRTTAPPKRRAAKPAAGDGAAAPAPRPRRTARKKPTAEA